MSEDTKKSQFRKFNPIAIDRLTDKYGVSKRYIRGSLNGERQSEMSQNILRDYSTLITEIHKATQKI